MAITYIQAISATLENNSKTITVTGEHVDFSKAADYLVALDNGLYVLPVASGTNADSNGDSTLTLAKTWGGATLNNKSLLIFPTFAKIYESVAAMTALNGVTRGILTKLKDLLTDTNPTLAIDLGQSSSIETVPYGYLTNQVTALIGQLNGLLGSVQAMTKPEFERVRLNELNRFPVAGTVNTDFASSFEFHQINGWQNKFRIKANKTRIDGVWHDYGDTDITLTAAPNGLQNKDLVSADFVDLDAAVVAGGTSLSQSYLNQRHFVYMVQEDIAAPNGLSTAYIQDAKNNIYSDDGVLRQRVFSFVAERLLESVEIHKSKRWTNTVNCMTSLGWTLSADVLGQWEKDGKKAVGVTIVQSRNQGAYHPALNSDGCRGFTSSGSSYGAAWHSSLVVTQPTSKADCFNPTIYAPPSGNIGNSTESGDMRPYDKFYDAIYSSDVPDNRMSVVDLPKKEVREKNNRKAKSGDVRGFEGVPFSKFITDTVTVAGAAVSDPVNEGGRFYWSVINNTLPNQTHVFSDGADLIYLSGSNGAAMTIKRETKTANILWPNDTPVALIAGLGELTQFYADKFNNLFPVGTIISIGRGIYSNNKQVSPTWKSIIGSVANIAALFTTVGSKFYGADGIEGEWIPTLPNSSLDLFPTNRKYKGSGSVRSEQTIDNGVTWLSQAVGIGSTTNSISLPNEPTNSVRLVHYETQAHFTENDVNAKVLDLGSVYATGWNNIAYGNLLISTLINKVGTNDIAIPKGVAWSAPLIDYGVRGTGGGAFDPALYGYPQHATIGLTGTGATAKALDYLSETDGVGELCYVYKEMKFDVDWGDNNKFEITDNQSAMTDDNGNSVLYGTASFETEYFIIEA